MNTELQKCMNGELYNCHDSIFIERKARAAAWCERYNDLHYSRRDEPRATARQSLSLSAA